MKENVVKIEEVYSEAEKREHEGWIARYRAAGSNLSDDGIISLEELRKERVTKKRNNIKKRNTHIISLNEEAEKILLDHYEDMGLWAYNTRLCSFINRIFIKALNDLSKFKMTTDYESYCKLFSVLNKNDFSFFNLEKQKEIKKENKSNIIQFRRIS